jgi:hypothetical protein
VIRSPIAAAAIAGVSVACAAARPEPASLTITADAALVLAGQFSIPPLTRFPAGTGPRFGGLSGLAATGAPGEYFVVSDDRTGHRFYRVRVRGEGPSFNVEVLETIRLADEGLAPRLDPEAIVVTPAGDLLIASESRDTRDRRVPPAIAQYTRTGAFVRQLPIRAHLIPNETGEAIRGVRENAGFESLTLSPSGRRLFSATETALVQDGNPVSFEAGTTARLLEYVAAGDSFVPGREFAYPLEAMDAPPFTSDAAASGIVELLALSENDLLALERTFIEAVAGQGRGINRIRLYHVSLDGAEDISAIDSLRARDAGAPVRKTLVLDLSGATDLSPELSTLDNFEGLAVGPLLSDGSRSLLIVSDDNFNPAQRSWFVQLRVVRQVNK